MAERHTIAVESPPRRNYDFLNKPNMGWEGFAAAIEVVEMPVYPGGLFIEPYVQLLAAELRDRIDRAQTSNDYDSLAAAG